MAPHAALVATRYRAIPSDMSECEEMPGSQRNRPVSLQSLWYSGRSAKAEPRDPLDKLHEGNS